MCLHTYDFEDLKECDFTIAGLSSYKPHPSLVSRAGDSDQKVVEPSLEIGDRSMVIANHWLAKNPHEKYVFFNLRLIGKSSGTIAMISTKLIGAISVIDQLSQLATPPCTTSGYVTDILRFSANWRGEAWLVRRPSLHTRRERLSITIPNEEWTWSVEHGGVCPGIGEMH